jgi:hypothetical protein
VIGIGAAAAAIRLGEAVVQEDSRRRDVRIDPVEDDPAGLVFVEPAIHEVPQVAPAL